MLSEAACCQIHSQSCNLTVQHLTPVHQPSFRLQAHKPAGGAITGEAYSLNDMVAVESQIKMECSERVLRFGHSVGFYQAHVFRFIFSFPCWTSTGTPFVTER